MRAPATQPTNAELGILQVIWEQGACTVRQVHEALGKERDLQYTTVLKTMLVMHEKGLLRRDASERSHVYVAVPDRLATQKSLIKDLLHRAFGGSAQELVMLAIQEEAMAPAEHAEIAELLEQARRKARP
jgi:predicted transcriptional regulator